MERDFWCNHDRPRVVSRFGDDTSEEMRIQSAKMLAIALHMLQGTPYIYQGEEIGMTDPRFTSIAQYRDVESINAYHQLLSEGHAEADVLAILGQKSRDNSRTPMQWSDDVNAGFTAGKPWIDISENYHQVNVRQALQNKESIFYTYQKLIQLRHTHDIITYGDIVPRFMDHDHLFVYERHYKNQQWLVIANFSASAVDLPEGLTSEGRVVIQTGTVENNTISGFGAIVIETNA